jgi:hypothetical protein
VNRQIHVPLPHVYWMVAFFFILITFLLAQRLWNYSAAAQKEHELFRRSAGGSFSRIGTRAGVVSPVLVQRHVLPGTAYFLAQHLHHTIKADPVLAARRKRENDTNPGVTLVIRSTHKSSYAEVINPVITMQAKQEKTKEDSGASGENKIASENVVKQTLQDAHDALARLSTIELPWITEQQHRRAPSSSIAHTQQISTPTLHPPWTSDVSSAPCNNKPGEQLDKLQATFPRLSKAVLLDLCAFSKRISKRKSGHQDVGGLTLEEAEEDVRWTEAIGWLVVRDRTSFMSAASLAAGKVAVSSTLKSVNQKAGHMATIELYKDDNIEMRCNLFYGDHNESEIHSHRANFCSFLVSGGYLATYWNVPNRVTRELRCQLFLLQEENERLKRLKLH